MSELNLLSQKVREALAACGWQPDGKTGATLTVSSPIDGSLLMTLPQDDAASVGTKVEAALAAQQKWQSTPRAVREAFLTQYAATLRQHLDALKALVIIDAGKTFAEAGVEAGGAANVLESTIKQVAQVEASLPTPRTPLGVVGVITSFNFPLAVAHWTIAPALLAGNSVLWKPSEKTPLVALACDMLFRKAAETFNDAQGTTVVLPGLLQVLVGGREAGEALVAHENVALISATGSVAMGEAIRSTLAKRQRKAAPSILELGGNNPVIFSPTLDETSLAIALESVLFSALASSGQRCTDTRRLIVHETYYDKALAWLKTREQAVVESGAIGNPYTLGDKAEAFGPLIDADAYGRYTHALQQAISEGGRIHFGQETFSSMPPESAFRLHAEEYPDAYYVKPVLIEMPSQREGGLLHEEVFAPVLYLLRYRDFDEALALAGAPHNAGLVQGLYTTSQQEADLFAKASRAGHAVINSRTGTGTPAHGLGFGGCRASGEGEILGLDPLAPFTRQALSLVTPPSFEAPQIATDGGITRRKYMLTHEHGRTRVVQHDSIAMKS